MIWNTPRRQMVEPTLKATTDRLALSEVMPAILSIVDEYGVSHASIAAGSADSDLAMTDGVTQIQLTVADRAARWLNEMALRLLERFARGSDNCCILVAG
jgi:hypothetical protein